MKNYMFTSILAVSALAVAGCSFDEVQQCDEEKTSVVENVPAVEEKSAEQAVEKSNPLVPQKPFPASFADVTLTSDENIDFAASPVSLYVACSSLAEIAANGETKDELLKAVSFLKQRNVSFCGTAMHKATHEERKSMVRHAAFINLCNVCDRLGLYATFNNAEWQSRTEPNMLLMSNSLWLSNNFELREDTADTRKELCFHTNRISMDETGRVEINSFVDKMTRGLIPEFIKELDPATEAILVNTLYFYANWANQFDANKSYEGDFYVKPEEATKVTYMKNSGQYLVAETDLYSAITLPYEPINVPNCRKNATETEMVVILPKNNQTNTAALKDYLNAFVNRCLPEFKSDYYDLTMPKFEINTELKLTEVLQKLGVKTAFSSKADFSNLSPAPLSISEVFQNVSIRVDEKGTEAAAATGIMLMRAMLPPPAKPFVVNRPFAFVISEKSTNSILFMGTVCEPKAPVAK